MTTGATRDRVVELLLSGGIDSVVAAAMLAQRGCAVAPVFVDHGQRCVARERAAAQRAVTELGLDPLACFDAPVLAALRAGEADPAWRARHLPQRNLLLLSIAAM